jgi:hypothetical protein
MKTTIVSILTVALLLAGCYADNGEELYNCSADAASISYSSTVKSILSGNGCTGCHNGSLASGGVELSTYAGIKARVDDQRLWGAVNHLPGFTPMPQGGSKISDCDIKRLKAWIDAGAPNN